MFMCGLWLSLVLTFSTLFLLTFFLLFVYTSPLPSFALLDQRIKNVIADLFFRCQFLTSAINYLTNTANHQLIALETIAVYTTYYMEREKKTLFLVPVEFYYSQLHHSCNEKLIRRNSFSHLLIIVLIYSF